MSAQIDDMVRSVVRNSDIRSATRYVTPTEIIRVTRRRFKRGRDGNTTLLLTLGTPNYRERTFVRKLKRAGKRLPKEVQIRYFKA